MPTTASFVSAPPPLRRRPRRRASEQEKCGRQIHTSCTTARTSSAQHLPRATRASPVMSSQADALRAEYARMLIVLRDLRGREAWSRVIATCSEMFDSALAPLLDPRMYAELFYALMKRSWKADADEALDVWSELHTTSRGRAQLGPRTYMSLMQLLSKHVMLDEAVRVRSEGRALAFRLNRFVYNAFLNACAKRSRLEEAFAALHEMADDGCTPDVVSFNCLIACCINSGDLDMALTLLERMKTWKVLPDIYSFNSIVNGLSKNNRLDDAFQLVARMEIEAANFQSSTADALEERDTATAQNAHAHVVGTYQDGELDVSGENMARTNTFRGVCPHEPDVCTYNTLLAGLANEDPPDLRRALRLKRHMERRGLVANEVTYNALMAAAARGNHIREAFTIYNEMMSCGLRPNCECFTTLITLCARARMVNRAFSVHEHMIEMGIKPTVVTFNALITACRHAAVGDRALAILETMKSRPDCQPDVVSYSAIIDTLGRAGQLDEAIALLGEMQRSGVEPNLVTYTSVIAAQTRGGDLDGAMATLADMEAKGVMANVYTFSSLVNGAGRIGAFAVAFDLLEKMRERNISPTVVTYVTLIDSTARARATSYLRRAIKEMNDDRIIAGRVQYEHIVTLSLDETIYRKDGRKQLDELLSAIRKSATDEAWGGLSRRPAKNARLSKQRRLAKTALKRQQAVANNVRAAVQPLISTPVPNAAAGWINAKVYCTVHSARLVDAIQVHSTYSRHHTLHRSRTMAFFHIAVVLLLLCATLLPTTSAIYNGAKTERTEFVQSYVHFGTIGSQGFLCGGVLITYHHVLTAAHCEIRADKHEAYLGSSVRHSRSRAALVARIASVDTHRKYGWRARSADIAIVTLRMAGRVRLGRVGVRPMVVDWTGSKARTGTQLITMGFG
eukprot:IDg12723t1